MNEKFTLHLGDCLATMRDMPDACVDSIVTDPPYHLTTDKKGGSGPASVNLESPYGRARIGTGFMGMKWDGGDIAQSVEMWAEALRVLKPGGHLLAFSGSRTYHRMVCAIEDAGFEIRDQIFWCFGSGFPKSHNLDRERGNAICGCEASNDQVPRVRSVADHASGVGAQSEDANMQSSLQRQAPVSGAGAASVRAGRAEGAKPEDARGEQPGLEGWGDGLQEARQLQGRALCEGAGLGLADGPEGRLHHGAPASNGRVVRDAADPSGGGASHRPQPDAQPALQPGVVAGQPKSQAGGAWPVCGGCGKPILPRGLGTALKPATEPIVVARKPLVGTVAANVLMHGTGAINIDACRVNGGARPLIESRAESLLNAFGDGLNGSRAAGETTLGRWPANLIHDGSEEVLAAFPTTTSGGGDRRSEAHKNCYQPRKETEQPRIFESSTGSAARFFYCAKASKADRCEDNTHPTVKPTNLMRYLCRLVTPPGGVVLDPFMGSGSTGRAAVLEGFEFVGIDMTPEYVEIARSRIGTTGLVNPQGELL